MNSPASSRDIPKVICVRSLVPYEKKLHRRLPSLGSTVAAIWSDTSAARGTSIIVPISYGIFNLRSSFTRSAVRLINNAWFSNSATVPIKGTMIRGNGFPPASIRSAAACIIASTCIFVSSGRQIPKRQPRRPSIGFSSCNSSICWTKSSTFSNPSSLADATVTSDAFGKNSWSGGSSNRTVTGLPSIARMISVKSDRWNAWSLDNPSSRRIHRRTTGKRSGAKNICSVRHRPIPCAPSSAALAASGPESAFAMTLQESLTASAHPNNVAKSLFCWDDSVLIGIRITSPVDPFNEITSPSLNCSPVLLMVMIPASSSMSKSSQPQIHGLPQPRATTAAWLVTPPRLVNMPCAAHIPPTSSGDVTARTKITPSFVMASAFWLVKTILPTAAPGPPANP